MASKDQDYRTLQSETAKQHGGHIPKGSEAAHAQSQADSSQANKDKDYLSTVARGQEQRALAPGSAAKQPEVLEQEHVQIPEEVKQKEKQLAEEKKQKTLEEFEKTPGLLID